MPKHTGFLSMSSLAPPRPRLVSTHLAVVALWTFVTVAVIAMTAVGQSLKTGRLDLIERIVWDAGWIGWAPLTYLVLAICRRYPIDRSRTGLTVARLAGVGVGVVLLQMTFDFACNLALGLLLLNTPFTGRHFVFIAVYKAHIYYGVYWMIVGAAHAIEYHRRYRESELTASQLETKLVNAELGRLKTQLQPHFLFNAHNTIVSLMLKQENDAAIRMLTRLSDLLRLSLSRSGQQIVTVREELATLRLYLDIQRERFRDRLTIDVAAPAALEDAEIPHLLLQPLVENALHHGLEDMTQDGRLEIAISRETETLICTVRDNGAGFAAANHPRAGRASGIGLANIRERLQQLYGARQSLVIASAPGEGCAVTLRFPYRNRSVAHAPAIVSA